MSLKAEYTKGINKKFDAFTKEIDDHILNKLYLEAIKQKIERGEELTEDDLERVAEEI